PARRHLAPWRRVRRDVHARLRSGRGAGRHPAGRGRARCPLVRAPAAGRGGRGRAIGARPRRGDPRRAPETGGLMAGRLARGEDPGAFFDRADIDAEQQSPDGRGGYVSGGWEASPGGSGIPVAIRPLSADERIRAMQAEADVTHEVITRVYVPGVRADNRL